VILAVRLLPLCLLWKCIIRCRIQGRMFRMMAFASIRDIVGRIRKRRRIFKVQMVAVDKNRAVSFVIAVNLIHFFSWILILNIVVFLIVIFLEELRD